MQTNRKPMIEGFRRRIGGQLERMDECAEDARLAVFHRRDEQALSEAQAWEALASTGLCPSLPISLSVKACFDVAGWVTTAASRVMEKAPPAERDAGLVTALRRQGAVIVNQSNMTEFAFGALGINASFGTPRSPLDPARERTAGGSTSGGAVSVALGFADVALGSDTSGSIRIPAAFCGLAGFKPSHHRYDRDGMLFLSPTFDIPGFIARDVSMLQRVDAAVTGMHHPDETLAVDGMRFLVPVQFAYADTDEEIASSFRASLEALRAAGATIVEKEFPELSTYGPIAVEGGIIIAEAYAWHRPYLEQSKDLYDPRVGPRIQLGADVRASAYASSLDKLAKAADAYHRRLDSFDALLTPTVPIIPPRVKDVEADESYYRFNRLTFRLTEVANRVDAPSVTIAPDPSRPVGFMTTGYRGRDARLLAVSRAIEAVFRNTRPTAEQQP
ncbi:amidase family protein [Rhizobium sp. WYJ-E13]|uniref:amidase family protein n=1 Tax=Rhizobium sp. WYJ-E13 TaxID=2849093 RepID=UPI001C1E8FD1|nr:amidase family protein [Rhizobium sp. WYJ-E13]QWW72398.1 amidase [Rhizobium sp. WYJ-E13]